MEGERQVIIVLPFCNKDAIAQVKNVCWMFELDGKTTFECLLAWPEGTKPEFIDKMRAGASKVFARVHEFQYPESTETTWPAGANWAWQSVARWIPMITNYKGNTYPFEKVLPENTPWLFLEPDAVPLKPGWMQTLADEYRRGGKPFMGHIVKDMGHMNGVGVYPNHVSHFARDAFHAVHAAWDVVLKEQTIELTHNANHLIQHCWVLINGQTSHNGDGIIATFRDTGEMHRLLEPNAVLFHRTKDGSLINCLMQAKTPVVTHSRVAPPKGETTEGNTDWKKIDDSVYEKGVSHETPTVLEGVKQDEYTTEHFPKTEIFIVTYAGDSGFRIDEKGKRIDCQFLKYCLYSIREFAAGFSGVTVMCPDRDVEVIEPVCREWGPENLSLEMFTEVEGKGMLHHMAIECMADQFCDADFILHFDSDLIFLEKVTPADYFVAGKPVLLMEAYERFKDNHPGVLRWQETTQKAIGKPVSFEFMRRHPAVHHRDIYAKTRETVEAEQKKPFLDWAVSGQNEFPQSWSEYNVLGAVAWIRARPRYHWINTGNDLPPKSKLWQGWSHGGLDRPSDQGQFVPQTPREIFKKVLGI